MSRLMQEIFAYRRVASGLRTISPSDLTMSTLVHSEFENTTLTGKNFAVLHAYPDREVEDAWRNCLTNGDVPTHFAAPEYFLEPQAADSRSFAVLALDPNATRLRVVGSLTGFIKNRTVTSGNIGTPQICIHKSSSPALVAKAFTDGLTAVSKGAELITLFSWFPMSGFAKAQFSETQTAGSGALDLSAGSQEIFSRVKGRSQVRHAISSGVEVREATPEELPEYYAILKDWSDRKGLPCPSLEVQRESFRLTRSRRLFIALYKGKIVAGTAVRFYPGSTAEYAWNASLPEFQHLRPNDLLHWRIIEWACQQGIHTYLLGATHSFALKYSDRVLPTYRYLRDETFFKTYARQADLTRLFSRTCQSLPPSLKEKLKRLRG